YDVPPEALVEALRQPYDLVVMVNPNSPTGRHMPKSVLAPILAAAHPRTRIWIDETYVDFVDPAQSFESLAAASANLIVCKSMSKAYALSGARVAYLCASPHQLEELRAWTPPWVVSLPAQAAAVRALQSPAYYTSRWRETRTLREQFGAALRYRGFDVVPGSANFLLTHLQSDQMPADVFVLRCRAHGLFLRDAARMGAKLGDRAVRFAVKDPTTQRHMLTIVDEVLR
ncbi:MAG TPA: aminotransferase class I/II-fold pyridoxal phosphate-dependent enzyme, partial [Verrucomicrobium sp.]|nr:aminotransferase class I/II-fold pyridoxal phosphate-dependent enzyme [Verrucomicrobium sp.]